MTSLTERDHALLVSLLKYRYLSSHQVERLHFTSHQTAARRLRLLARAGYVTLFRVCGIEEEVVSLAEPGARIVADDLLITFQDLGWCLRREDPKDYHFMKHFLLAGDFRITLTQACATTADLQLLGFIPEHLSERGAPKGILQKYVRDVVADIAHPGEKVVHTPDAVFALARDGGAALFFLEIDRGIETLADVEHGFPKTIRFYLNYMVSGGYQRYVADLGVSGAFKGFRVLVLTASSRRLQNIRALCGRLRFEPANTKRFLWLQTLEITNARDLMQQRSSSGCLSTRRTTRCTRY